MKPASESIDTAPWHCVRRESSATAVEHPMSKWFPENVGSFGALGPLIFVLLFLLGLVPDFVYHTTKP